MVRKWSYIILPPLFFQKLVPNTLLNIKNTSIVPTKQNTKERFKFKIFRKTTRFKLYNIGYVTKFVRKYVAIKKRRTTWKTNIILVSGWVKPILNYKQFFSFLQSKYLFTSVMPYPYTKIFDKKTSLLTLTHKTPLNLNYNSLKSSLYKKFKFNKGWTSFNTNLLNLNYKYFTFIQFNSITSLIKLRKSIAAQPSLIRYESSFFLLLPQGTENTINVNFLKKLKLLSNKNAALKILVALRNFYINALLLTVLT